MKLKSLPWLAGLACSLTLFGARASLALPPPDDLPEEVLRTRIVLEARSPLDGSPLTAAEYAELAAELATSTRSPQLDPRVQNIVFLLQIYQALRILTPFL